MKTCPHCTSGYSDALTSCPTHGVLLNEIRDLRPGLEIRSTYKITRKLGQGGMGAVYLADHLLMEEQRALKFLSPELAADEQFTARFLREVKTLRRLRHPNVVECDSLERAEDNSLFFAMEFVDGPDLRHLMEMARGPMPVTMALEIASGIAEGLGAAHKLGLVHRDVKPENILMARDGEAWQPKIADFGIVATKEVSTQHTRTGASLLTMTYAAPEQWRGTRAADLDGRTDLYALGGVLYEMLTGRTAFDAENYEGWFMQHLTVAPKPPSEVNPALKKYPGLDALVLMLLEKEREKRPDGVAELLHGLGTAGEQNGENLAERLRHTPQPKPKAAIGRTSLDPGLQRPKGLELIRTLSTAPQNIFNLAFAPDGAQLASCGSEGTITLWNMDSGDVAINIQSNQGWMRALSFDSSGSVLATGGSYGNVKLWGRKSGDRIRTMGSRSIWNFLGVDPSRWDICFSPDGKVLAVASSELAVELFDVASGELVHSLKQHRGAVSSVRISSNGRMLASGSYDHHVILWNFKECRVKLVLQGHENRIYAVLFSPDDSMLISGSSDRTIRIWNAATGECLRTMEAHGKTVNSLSLSKNGRYLASGSADHTVKIWNLISGELVHTITEHTDAVEAVAFSPDGKLLASGGRDKTIKLWDVAHLSF